MPENRINELIEKLGAIDESLDELTSHIIIYTEENKKLFQYVRDLARLNGWKLPEKQKKPVEVE